MPTDHPKDKPLQITVSLPTRTPGEAWLAGYASAMRRAAEEVREGAGPERLETLADAAEKMDPDFRPDWFLQDLSDEGGT